VSDSVAKKIMGYAPNSTVFQRYVHLSDKETAKAFCKSEGIVPPTSEEPLRLPPSGYTHPLAQDSSSAEIEHLKLEVQALHAALRRLVKPLPEAATKP
jgi:hypothetical protein